MENQTILPRKKRTSGRKVRTGCITCRIRRVKCDEGKPECTRCLNFSWKCDGYFPGQVTKPQQGIARLEPRVPVPRTPAPRLFNDDQEYSYFQRFCSYTVTQLTGLRESEVWNRVILQATQAEPCIRHAATAIGALDFKNQPGSSDGSERLRREFSYSEYQRAIVGLRKSIAAKDCDTRTKLISCILFACFESYHGNTETALSQVFAGIEMMEEYSKSRERLKQTTNACPPPIDEDIVQTFALLEIQMTAWGDPRSADLHLERMQSCAAAVENIPVEFKSLKQAGSMLSMNMLRGIHLRFAQTNRSDGPPNSNIPPFIGVNSCLTSPAVSELGRVLSKFREWSQAFEPLYRKAMTLQGKQLFEGAILLRMHCLGCALWVASGSPTIELYFRRYTKELREIVELAKALLGLLDDQSFSLDMMIILPLAVVGWNYRHRALRREVIDIFSSINRREGVWDSAMLGKIMEWISEIEEEGLEDGEYVPEDAVATLVNLKVDHAQRSVLVGCQQGVNGVSGQTVYKEATLYW